MRNENVTNYAMVAEPDLRNVPSTRLMSAFCNIQHVTLPSAVTVLVYFFGPPFFSISAPKKSSPSKRVFIADPSSAVITDSVEKVESRNRSFRPHILLFQT
jgi:hypothetical protein